MDRVVERELLAKCKAGDLEAQNELLRVHDRFVWKVVHRLKHKNVSADVDDLAQAGRCGLLHAVQMWDESFGKRFLTYAGYWVRNHVQRELPSGDLIRVPFHVRERDCSEESRKHADVAWNVRSLSQRRSDGDDVLDPPWPGHEDDCLWTPDQLLAMRQAVDKLQGPHYLAIVGRFHDGMTLNQVGERMRLTRERVRQIQIEALRELKLLYREMMRRRQKEVTG